MVDPSAKARRRPSAQRQRCAAGRCAEAVIGRGAFPSVYNTSPTPPISIMPMCLQLLKHSTSGIATSTCGTRTRAPVGRRVSYSSPLPRIVFCMGPLTQLHEPTHALTSCRRLCSPGRSAEAPPVGSAPHTLVLRLEAALGRRKSGRATRLHPCACVRARARVWQNGRIPSACQGPTSGTRKRRPSSALV
jgi:hypothetical protein